MPSIINATTTNGVAISPDNSGSLQLATNNGTTAVTIDTSQNVGIGITTPQQTLHVNNTSSPRIKLTNATTGTGSSDGSEIAIFDADNSLRINNLESANILFGTGGSERMRINSSGVVCIGTTTQVGLGRTVVAYDSGSFVGITINQTNAGAAGFLMSFRLNGTEVGSIYQNTSTTAYNTSSDYRLKENIAPMTGALNKVLQLKPCTYTWKATGEAGEGFIAHELQAVVPDAVTGEKDAVDEEGNIKPQGIDTSFLVATLTAAIQEQQAMIETLKTELDTVKAEVQALKGVA